MDLNYCRRCGSLLTNLQDHIYICEQGHTIYNNASPSVGVFILDKDNNVMLSVRGIEPSKGKLDAIGGFIDGLETAESAIERELKEETGLLPDQYSRPIYLGSATSEYTTAKENVHVLTLLYYTHLKPGATLVAMDDVASIETIPVMEVPLDKLHNVDIVAGVKLLQDKLKD